MAPEKFNMVQECASRYAVTDNANGGVSIAIDVPPRFKYLWLVRLKELTTDLEEIGQYESINEGG